MNFDWSADSVAFRDELRAWLSDRDFDALPDDLDAQVKMLREWQAELAGARFVGVHWPQEYGGRDLGWLENFILQEELARARAPEIINRIGVNLVGPTLLAHGTHEQKSRLLPGILPATELWAQLFSEPGAGSDLASLTTAAVRDGDRYVINGQKVWSSYAQFARWGYCLARTDPGAPKPQAGITALVVDMHAPGVEIRPLQQMTGEMEFNEVFLTDVGVPVANRIGDENAGWTIASTTLGHERGTSPRQLVIHMMLLDELMQLAAERGADASVRQQLARAHSELTIFRLHNFRTLSSLERTGSPGAASSVVKLFWSEMSQRMHDAAMQLLGVDGIAGDHVGSRIVRNFLYYRAATIFAGTSEIQRNVLGERVLQLPKEPRT